MLPQMLCQREFEASKLYIVNLHSTNFQIGDFSIPVLKKHAKKSITEEENEGPVELFPSDSDDDDLLLK